MDTRKRLAEEHGPAFAHAATLAYFLKMGHYQRQIDKQLLESLIKELTAFVVETELDHQEVSATADWIFHNTLDAARSAAADFEKVGEILQRARQGD